jgi:hypothetical protein
LWEKKKEIGKKMDFFSTAPVVDHHKIFHAWNQAAVIYQLPELYHGVSLLESALLRLILESSKRIAPTQAHEGFLDTYFVYERVHLLTSIELFLAAFMVTKNVFDIDERQTRPNHQILSKLLVKTISLTLGIPLRRHLLLKAIAPLQLHVLDLQTGLGPHPPLLPRPINSDEKLLLALFKTLGRAPAPSEYKRHIEVC